MTPTNLDELLDHLVMMTATNIHPLLRAICENPADDTLRLIYADWLEEQGESDRAEFIRVQVKLDAVKVKMPANRPLVTYDYGWVEFHNENPQVENLRRRERELWTPNCNGWFVSEHLCVALSPHDFCNKSVHGIPRRGFIDEIHCRLEDWYGTECRLKNPCDRFMGKCPYCHGTGRVGGHGPTIVSCQPITRVSFTSRYSIIPEEWWEPAAKLIDKITDPHERLSIVAVNWARRQAGLQEVA